MFSDIKRSFMEYIQPQYFNDIVNTTKILGQHKISTIEGEEVSIFKSWIHRDHPFSMYAEIPENSTPPLHPCKPPLYVRTFHYLLPPPPP